MAWALLPAAPAIVPALGLETPVVSWHLHGSLPRSVYPPGKLLSGQAFVSVDRHLDNAQRGPLFLRQEAVAGSWQTPNDAEFQRIGAYIENNPVKAGLVARAGDYPWSNAADLNQPGIETSLDAGVPSMG